MIAVIIIVILVIGVLGAVWTLYTFRQDKYRIGDTHGTSTSETA